MLLPKTPTGLGGVPYGGQFTSSNAGKTGLTVTVSVVRLNTDGTRAVIISAASNTAATETDATNLPGVYHYLLSAALAAVAGTYFVNFHTTGTADCKDIPAVQLIGPDWVQNVDTTVSSRSSHSAADVWAVGTRTLTGFGTLVADVAAAVWAAASRTLTNISGGVVSIVDPVSASGRLTLRAGYAYTGSRNNAPAWTLSSTADLTGATGYLRFVTPDGTDAVAAMAGTLGGTSGAYTFKVDVPAATTTALLVGKTLRYGVEARYGSGSTPILLASGDVVMSRTP